MSLTIKAENDWWDRRHQVAMPRLLSHFIVQFFPPRILVRQCKNRLLSIFLYRSTGTSL